MLVGPKPYFYQEIHYVVSSQGHRRIKYQEVRARCSVIFNTECLCLSFGIFQALFH